MCGIVGQAFRTGRCDPEILTAMRNSMRHRGPDDTGEWYSPDFRIGLAHTRLSIIDLSAYGSQPMQDGLGEIAIVFNGEIYNFIDLREHLEDRGHTFKSKSDTEVVLEAYREWGTDCLNELNGMFAFCIYDVSKRILFLARDRAGEKPLYYRCVNEQFAFSSELKALLADPHTPRRLNVDAVNYYLAYGHVPCPLSMLDGVAKLPQAHAMTYNTDTASLRIWKYWELPDPLQKNNASLGDLCEELKVLLHDSVRRQLISDVPIAVLLSGGCDSSLIAALAGESTGEALKTFTVSFPGHEEYDEARYAKIVSEYLGTEHTEVVVADPSPDLILELATKFDEPCADHAMIPTYLVSKAIRDHAKVALTGDGGDELFGGYSHYASMLRLDRLKSAVPSAVRLGFSNWVLRCIPVGIRFRNHMIGFGKNFPGSVAHINLYFDEYSRSKLLDQEIVRRIDSGFPEKRKAGHCVPAHSLLRQAMQTDFLTTLTDSYLVKVDRASMLASVESRAPLLDYRVIEFAFRSVPDKFKVANGQKKILLRTLAEGLLPRTLNLSRKQGFSMPISKWLEGNWGQFMQSILCESSSLFDSKCTANLFRHEGRIRSNSNRLYALTILELWRRNHKVSI